MKDEVPKDGKDNYGYRVLTIEYHGLYVDKLDDFVSEGWIKDNR